MSFYHSGEDDPSLNKGGMEMHFVPLQPHSTTSIKGNRHLMLANELVRDHQTLDKVIPWSWALDSESVVSEL